MGRGQTSLGKIHWPSDFEVEYEAYIVSAELRPTISGTPLVAMESIKLKIATVAEKIIFSIIM
jgi:hypothetical protein